MINTKDVKKVAEQLTEWLETPVSEKLVEVMSEKDRWVCLNNLQFGNGALAKFILNKNKPNVAKFESKKTKKYHSNLWH
jgi:hypothetical protein